MIYVCGLAEMPAHVRSLRPASLVSLLPEEDQPPTPPEVAPPDHLRLSIDDIVEPLPGRVAPEARHIETLVGFLRERAAAGPLLLHCWAGISRSMAAALIALAIESEGRELEVARRLRRVAPHAQPNARMVALADELLGRDGRLLAAREAMGEARLLVSGPLVRIPR